MVGGNRPTDAYASFTRGLDNWGINFERFIPRNGRIWLRWSSPTLDSFVYDLSRAGVLSGVGGLEQGKGLEISPYATGKTTETNGGSPRAWLGQVGGDVTWKITPQLVGVGRSTLTSQRRKSILARST